MKPDDIPQDVWDYAEIALKFVPSGDDNAQIDSVSRAILAECERCAKVAEKHDSPGQMWATAKLAAGYAVRDISAAIRKGD